MTQGNETTLGRRHFLSSVALLAAPMGVLRAVPLTAQGTVDVTSRRVIPSSDDFPRNDPARVQRVVGASHGNLDVVRALVSEQTALAKASWDWGFGDWETPLGAASHTGRREIATFLIGNGARPTLFSAAMMGEIDTVRAFLTADPGLYRLHGPHGISLLRHARAGGAEAQSVVDYLLERFGPDEAVFGVPGDEAVAARYGGRYRFETDPVREMSVGVRNDWLMVSVGEQPTVRVLEAGPDAFYPTGAPAVRFLFEVVDGRARSLTIEDGPSVITGRRLKG